ncbi:MAG: GH92 family glycosyl hydrolase [Ignavibacteria bacterium]|nr:GH92 family glycosyl hydrolase [Ignavibacteria bacterium]
MHASRISLAIVFLCAVFAPARAQDALGFVNPFIGTGGHGHTFPGATRPFGMVQLSPDTRVEGWDACGGYHYSDSSILGFSHTHLSGTGVPDYGDILLMPTVGKLTLRPGDARAPGSGYRSRFSHREETASPGFYAVRLLDPNIRVELTATERTGFHRYSFPKAKQAHIVVDLRHGLGPDVVTESELRILNQNELAGFRRSTGWAKDQRVYFVMRVSKPMTGGLVDSIGAQHESLAAKGGVVAGIRYETANDEQILVKVGISGVDIEGARRNLDAENPGWNFDGVRTAAALAWERELSKISVEGGSTEQHTVFATALYHSMIAPNIWSDVDGRYRGMDGRTHRAEGWTMYTVFSLWDTFRALHPLLTIIDRARTRDFVRSLIAKGEEAGGQLPVWELAGNETFCMIGNHAIPVIVDAWAKGIRDFDSTKAEALMASSAQKNRGGTRVLSAAGD